MAHSALGAIIYPAGFRDEKEERQHFKADSVWGSPAHHFARSLLPLPWDKPL